MITHGKLIGIVGYAGSGKTSVSAAASSAWNSPSNIHCRNFSEPIINMLAAMGVPSEILRDKTRWNEPLDILCGHSTRYATTTLGTEWGRNYIGVEVWTRIEMNACDKLRNDRKHVMIDNVRFPSEMNEMKVRGAVFIALKRPGLTPNFNHASEQHIAKLQSQCDYEIVNDGGIDVAIEKMRQLLVDIIA